MRKARPQQRAADRPQPRRPTRRPAAQLSQALAEPVGVCRTGPEGCGGTFRLPPRQPVALGHQRRWERYLVVIDALDEAGEAGRNSLVEMLARNTQRLTDWIVHESVLGN